MSDMDDFTMNAAAAIASDQEPLPGHVHPKTGMHLPDTLDHPADVVGQHETLSRYDTKVHEDLSVFVPNINPYTVNLLKLHASLAFMMRFDSRGNPVTVTVRDLRIVMGSWLMHAANNRVVRARRASYTGSKIPSYLITAQAAIKLERWMLKNRWIVRAPVYTGERVAAWKAEVEAAKSDTFLAQRLAEEQENPNLRSKRLKNERVAAVAAARRLAQELGVDYQKPVRQSRKRQASVTAMDTRIIITQKGIATFGVVHNWLKEWWDHVDGMMLAGLKEQE